MFSLSPSFSPVHSSSPVMEGLTLTGLRPSHSLSSCSLVCLVPSPQEHPGRISPTPPTGSPSPLLPPLPPSGLSLCASEVSVRGRRVCRPVPPGEAYLSTQLPRPGRSGIFPSLAYRRALRRGEVCFRRYILYLGFPTGE